MTHESDYPCNSHPMKLYINVCTVPIPDADAEFPYHSNVVCVDERQIATELQIHNIVALKYTTFIALPL